MITRFPDFCDLSRLKNARTSREIYGMKINFGEKEKGGGGKRGGKRRNSFLRRANEWHRFSTGRGNSLVLFLSATQLFELNAVFKRNVLSCCREKTVSTPAWPQIKNLFQRRAGPQSVDWVLSGRGEMQRNYNSKNCVFRHLETSYLDAKVGCAVRLEFLNGLSKL